MNRLVKLCLVLVLMVSLVPVSTYAQGPYCTLSLMAGQHIHVGYLNVAVDSGGENLVVTYDLTGDEFTQGEWGLLETHLYLDSVPPDNSAPGTFPFLHDGDYYNGYEQIDSYKIPLSALSDYFGIDCNEEFNIYEIYIAAHAEVTPLGDSMDIYSEETAWAGDPENPLYIRPDKNWAMYFYCEIPCDFDGDTYTYYRDSDKDDHGDPYMSVTTTNPEPPLGYVTDNTDCDDTDATVHPDAPEICDQKDNDCDGAIDEELTRDCSTICGDGIETCENGDWVGCSAPLPSSEVCDGLDNDCDGTIDEELTRDCSTICGDGIETCENGDWIGCSAPLPSSEVCDGLDNDCDGIIDEDCTTYYQDSDEDGYGDPNVSVTTTDPEIPPGYVADNTDCDDIDEAVHPGAPEICDQKDNNCDGFIPGNETADTDGDGVVECADNCPDVWDPNQTDSDGNGIGDVCELTIGIYYCDPNNNPFDPTSQEITEYCSMFVPEGGLMEFIGIILINEGTENLFVDFDIDDPNSCFAFDILDNYGEMIPLLPHDVPPGDIIRVFGLPTELCLEGGSATVTVILNNSVGIPINITDL
ncbi:MAG: putative metal-binding motif-containing protein [bacterium]